MRAKLRWWWPLTLVLCLGWAGTPLGAEERFVDSDGVMIRYQVDGEGEPVLLIHGYRASGDLNWRLPGIVADLARSYRVLTLDNRGHGGSDKPEEPSAYGSTMVKDALAVLDDAGVNRAHVVGYSMGGMITLKLLVMHPERVRSAVIGGMGWTEAGEETERRYREAPAPSEDPAMNACFRGFADLAVSRAALQAIAVPMTVLVGSEDGLYRRSVQPLQEVRPDVPVVLIEGASHMSAVTHPELRGGIRSFLDAQSAAAAAATAHP